MKDFLYQQLADKLETMITQGVYKVGDKLPSVRALQHTHEVSLSTALQVYSHLEKKGMVEAREKSGYYVQLPVRQLLRLPGVSKPTGAPVTVRVTEQVELIKVAEQDEKVISLIGPSPHTSLMPAGKLHKALSQALREHKTAYIPYSDISGFMPLRQQIARRSLFWEGSVSPEDIIITNGAIEAVSVCLRAVAKAGDTIAIESPTFFGLLQTIESLGMKALEIPTDPVTGICLEPLEQAMRQKKIKACLLVPSYNNPLGSCMPDSHKQQLAAMLQRYQIPLIEDDVYGDLHFGNTRPKTIKTFDHDGLVLHCSSFSKTLSAGLRVGWAIPGRFLHRVEQLKFISSASTGILPQIGIANYLQHHRPEQHLKQLRQALQIQLAQLIQAVKEHFPPETRITRPEGGFSLWVELPPKTDAWALHQQALEQYQVTFTPGGLFGCHGKFHHCLRLSAANPWDDNQAYALRMLGKLIRQQLK